MASAPDDPIGAMLALQRHVDNAATGASAVAKAGQPWTKELVSQLALSVLAFCAFALVLSTLLLWRSRASGQSVLRTFGVISIIGFSAMLLIVGYNNDQLTPIVGLFGAIAGYLLGKETRPEPPERKNSDA